MSLVEEADGTDSVRSISARFLPVDSSPGAATLRLVVAGAVLRGLCITFGTPFLASQFTTTAGFYAAAFVGGRFAQ